MPSNEQRRAAAKRKLERQLANRAERARKRKQLTIVGSVLGVAVLVGAVAGVYFLTKGEGESTDNAAGASFSAAPAPDPVPKPETVNCLYTDGAPSAKPVQKPSRTEGIPTTGADAKVSVSMDTNQGPLGLTLNNAESPCTVNSFVSLATQGFFDETECHRMTTSDTLKVLQCGDPTATGQGGPGYMYANEYPTDQYAEGDPASMEPIRYERGVLAMANAGAGTNGSQFFLVYGDSQLPPQYTIFGTVDESSLATLDKIAEIGQDDSNGPGDGKPNTPVTIQAVSLD